MATLLLRNLTKTKKMKKKKKNAVKKQAEEDRFVCSMDQHEEDEDEESKGSGRGGGGEDRFFLNLCTLFVATIEDAKDRISQLELVFCNQLFPAFQSKISQCSSSSSSYDADEKTSEEEICKNFNVERKNKREAILLRELRDLRDERDSLLKTQDDRLLLRTQVDELLREAEDWKNKRDEVLKELQDLRNERVSLLKTKELLRSQIDGDDDHHLAHEAKDLQRSKRKSVVLQQLHDMRDERDCLLKKRDDQYLLRTQIDELNRQLIQQDKEFKEKIQSAESEFASMRKAIYELQQQLRAKNSNWNIQAVESESESLSADMHGLHHQLREAKESDQNIQALESESPECFSKLRRENVELLRRCTQLSSDLSILKAKLRSSSSLIGSLGKGSDSTEKKKSEEMNCSSLKKQFTSEIEKERNTNRTLLNKLSALKKSYRSLRKQYTVLFRRTHPMGMHHKDTDVVSICEKKDHHHHRDAKDQTHTHNDIEDAKETSDCKSVKKCTESSSLNPFNLMENEDDSDQKPCVPAPARKPKIQVNQVLFELKHGKPMLKEEAITTFAHCSPPKSRDSVQIQNTDKHPCPENENDHYDDMILDLANVEKSENKDLHQENVFENRMIDLDKASQVGSVSVSQFNVLQPNSNTYNDDILVDGMESCSPGRSRHTHGSQIPTTSFAPMRRSIQQVNNEVKDDQEAMENGWLPVQKRALSGGSYSKSVKSLKTKWRNTRTEQTGFDPHDDFLNTPLENVLNGNTEKAMKSSGDINTLYQNGKTRHGHHVDCGVNGVSFSQVTTQAPVGDGNGFDENENENTSEKHEEEKPEAILQPSAMSNLKLKRDRPNVEPLGIDKTNSNTHKHTFSRAKLPSSSKPGPMYKYIEPVRKKDEREKLQGVECNQCKKFYDAVLMNNGSSGTARCEHHNYVSRHRYRYVPPSTPEGFWNIGFDSDL